MTTTKNKTTLVHLEELKPTYVNHHLRLRVVHVWTVPEWNNPKKIKTFEMVFVDELESDQDTTRSTRRTTIIDFLRERITNMDDGSHRLRRRKSIREHLGLKNIICCVSAFGHESSSTLRTRAVDEDDDDQVIIVDSSSVPQQINAIDVNAAPSPRMNLADALAAERYFRSATSMTADQDPVYDRTSPLRVSLMRLLEETDEAGQEKTSMGDQEAMCCVCMGRKKGAAFIPCGHTFCRACSRELWVNRGNCPLCNRSILEILDIY